jgi:hypothetical protein
MAVAWINGWPQWSPWQRLPVLIGRIHPSWTKPYWQLCCLLWLSVNKPSALFTSWKEHVSSSFLDIMLILELSRNLLRTQIPVPVTSFIVPSLQFHEISCANHESKGNASCVFTIGSFKRYFTLRIWKLGTIRKTQDWSFICSELSSF